MTRSLFVVSTVALVIALGGCAMGPDYLRPELDRVEHFKQVTGWKLAQPADLALRQEWWTLYNDQQLNQLMEQLNSGNQNLAAAEAAYRQAQALVRGARAELLPSVGLNSGVSRSGAEEGVSKNYEAALGVSWELDLWGRLRRALESEQAELKASQADLAAVRLSQQSELAQNYLELRVLDRQQTLLNDTVSAYQQAYRIAENQYKAGIVAKSDVTQALTQLKGTQSEAIGLERQRAQREHAIAVLIGLPPSEFSLPAVDTVPMLPSVPVSLPSALLERRPDVAAAERRVMAANAEIGVAQAAYFPELSLTASGGYRGAQLADWISSPNRFWSIGPAFAVNLFDGGLLRSRVEQAEARYDETVAQYRQTVLSSFREVEDYLVQLAVLARETQVQQQALDAARESLSLILNQYKAGTVDFTDVVSVQTSALSQERARLNLLSEQLRASVDLIAALGGGWQGLSD